MISETELKHAAYIFKCEKSTLPMKGKVNSTPVDNRKKFGRVFDSVMGIVESTISKDIQIQVMGRVPAISTNKTEGCHTYLTRGRCVRLWDCEHHIIQNEYTYSSGW